METLLGKGLQKVGTLIATLTISIHPSVAAVDTPETTQPTEARLLLAKRWDPASDPTGWWISEKYDGVRAHWDGNTLWTRGGNRISAPDYFLAELPKGIGLDGELWFGRGQFETTVSIVRRETPDERWQLMSYMIFDSPTAVGTFEERMEFVRKILPRSARHVKRVPQTLCLGAEHLIARRDRIVESGGEGLMIRKPDSLYESGYSSTLLKVKPHTDGEAVVIGHKPGKGKYEGKMGSLRVKTADGREFSVGSGFTNAERAAPPRIGSRITYRYRGLTKNGLPRFPTYLQVPDE
jgi:DNA ligase 1